MAAGRVRERLAAVRPGPHHETGAVEAGARVGAAPRVAHAEDAASRRDRRLGTLADRRVGDGARRGRRADGLSTDGAAGSSTTGLAAASAAAGGRPRGPAGRPPRHGGAARPRPGGRARPRPGRRSPAARATAAWAALRFSSTAAFASAAAFWALPRAVVSACAWAFATRRRSSEILTVADGGGRVALAPADLVAVLGVEHLGRAAARVAEHVRVDRVVRDVGLALAQRRAGVGHPGLRRGHLLLDLGQGEAGVVVLLGEDLGVLLERLQAVGDPLGLGPLVADRVAEGARGRRRPGPPGPRPPPGPRRSEGACGGTWAATLQNRDRPDPVRLRRIPRPRPHPPP